MAIFVNAYITDVNLERNRTWMYCADDVAGNDNTESVVEGILLLDATAKTNVCFKGADGKFISYRNLDNHDVRLAVETLRPFPIPAR